MKKSIKAIAAVAAALTMTLSCVPRIYAVGNVPAVQAEAETEAKTGFEFTVGKTVDAPYNGIAKIADEDGTAYYYSGYDNGGMIIYTLDENGSIKNSYTVERHVNEKGEKIRLGYDILKKCGDDLYFIYSEYFGFSMREKVIVKLDKELNEVARYKAPKCVEVDTNGEKIVYMKNHRTIYSMDMDGKNKKAIFTMGQGNEINNMNFLVVSGDYVGFEGEVCDSFIPKNNKDYCVYINLKTDEVTMKEQRSVQQLYGSNDKIIWYSSESRDIRDSYMTTVPNGEDVTEYIIKQDKKEREYFKDGESYVLDNGKYYVLKTQSPRESYGLTIDNDGNVITCSYNNGRYDFKFYRDNKLIDTYSADFKGYCGFTANNGVLTICYDGKESSAGDWVALPPNMTDSEYEEYLASMPAPKIDYTMKSVTISYK